MKTLRTLRLLVLLLPLALSACNTTFTPPAPSPDAVPRRIELDPTRSFVAGQVIVGYQEGSDPAQLAASLNARVVTDWPQLQAALLELPTEVSTAKAQTLLTTTPGVRYAHANRVFWHEPVPGGAGLSPAGGLKPAAVGDPAFARQWQHRQLNSQAAWDLGLTGRGIRIGIHDDYLDHRHPDLVDNILYPGLDGFKASTAATLEEALILPDTPHDGMGTHGTSVAGSAAAVANAIGGRGVAYEADLVPLAINDPLSGALTLDGIVNAAVFAVTGPDGLPGGDDRAPGTPLETGPYVHIVNMSWGGPAYDQLVKDAIDFMLSHRIVLVVAAGNVPSEEFQEPAWFPGVITVAATLPTDERTSFSNRGEHLNVAAPGEQVWVPTTRGCVLDTPDGSSCTAESTDYIYINGTSFSSPLTAGVAALILGASATRDAGGTITAINLSPAQVRRILEQTARKPPGYRFEDLGHGIVDAAAAVQLARDRSRWPEAGASLAVTVNLTADPTVALADVGLSLIALDEGDGPTKYTQTADGRLGAVGQGLFLGLNPGRYRLVASGPHTATLGVEAATAETELNLPSGASELALQLDVPPPVDALEPNDSVAEAATVAPGTTVKAYLYGQSAGASDTDIYALEVTDGDSYRVNTETITGSFDTYLRVLADDGETVIAENDNNQAFSGDALVDFTASTTGTVYLEVTELTGTNNPFNAYALDVATLGDAEVEPNGSARVEGQTITNVDLSAAQSLALGSAVDAVINPATDADIYAVELTPGTVVADIETAEAGLPDTMLALYDAAGIQLAFNDDFTGRESRLTHTVETGGTFYLAVVAWDAFGEGGTAGPYSLAMTSQVNPD